MNFFGALGQLGRMLPGYVEGRRQAIQDNWQDLSNYNQVLHGQLRNAFDVSTWEPQLSNMWNQASLNGLAALQGLGNFALWEKTYPEQLKNALLLYRAGVNNQLALSRMMPQLLPQLFPQQQPTATQPPVQQAQQPTPTTADPKRLLPAP